MSQASDAIGNGAASGAGATTSTPCAASIGLPPSAPSRASRPMSLRPIIPAAPITTIFNGLPSLYLDPAIFGAERAVPGGTPPERPAPASLRESPSPLHVTRFDRTTEAKSWPAAFLTHFPNRLNVT